MNAVKEASIDCTLHSVVGGNEEKLQCFSFGSVEKDKFSYSGSYTDEEVDAVAQQNMRAEDVKAKKIVLDGVTYAYDESTGAVYDYENYKQNQIVRIGTIESGRDNVIKLVFM